MATQTASVSVLRTPVLQDPEELIPKVRAQLTIIRANLGIARRDLAVEGLTFGLEPPSAQGLDKTKVDPILNSKVKPHSDRIALLEHWLAALTNLLTELKETHRAEYLEALKKEQEEIVATCQKECAEPLAALQKEIEELEQQIKAQQAQGKGQEQGYRQADKKKTPTSRQQR